MPEKFSPGLAKVLGAPPDFQGINLRSAAIELKGAGASARKASGLLMLDGVLYLLARNAGNAQLAWSEDHGANWTWADWKFTESFGAPTFVNFGRNYAGARDDFVYVISHDANSAYKVADGFVLARAPRGRLPERAAWEFFSGMKDNRPQWTTDAARRAPISEAPGKCYRTGCHLQCRAWSLSARASRAVGALPGSQRQNRYAFHRRAGHPRSGGAVGSVEAGVLH